MRKEPYNIDNILVSLAKSINKGVITIKQAGVELYNAGWYNYIPSEEQVKYLLKLCTMDKREQLQELDWTDINGIMCHFFVSQCNSWQAEMLDKVTDQEEVYLAVREMMIDKICKEVSCKELMDFGYDIYTKEEILKECEAFLDENYIAHDRYEENGECVGITIETWTDCSVHMLHLIDGRDRDMDDSDWWKDELDSIYEAFDVDVEIDIHRQSQTYRDAFTHRMSVDDFEAHEEWLRKLSESARVFAKNLAAEPTL